MFGNTLGWIISAVITAVFVINGYLLYESGQPTPATSWSTTHGRPLTLDARRLLGPTDPAAGDAGKLYRGAISAYAKHPESYTGLQTMMDAVDAVNEASGREGLQLMIKARKCASMSLFREDPKEVINYETELPAIDTLDQLVKTSNNVSAQMVADASPNYTKAEEYAMASLAVGFNLYRERLARAELDKSEDFMGSAAAILKIIYEKRKQTDKLAAVEAFDTARKAEVADSIDPVEKVIFNIGDDNLNQHVGDYYALAADPKADPLWRIEATRRIGHVQYYATRLADQRKAPRFLTKLAAEPNLDPAIKTAAEAASKMTPAENQCTR